MGEADGYFGHEDPYLDRDLDDDDDDNDDDEQEVDTTRPFQPGSASTPYHGGEQYEMQTMQHEQSGLPDTSYEETPLLEGFIHKDDKPTMAERYKKFIKSIYPNADFKKLGPIGFSKKPGNETTFVSFGPRGGETEILKKDGSGLLKNFTNKYKDALGPKAETLIAQYNDSIRDESQILREFGKQLRDGEKIAAKKEKAARKLQDLRNKKERTKVQIEALTQEHGSNLESESELQRLQQLLKNYETDFENAKKEVAPLEKQEKQKAKEQEKVDRLRANLTAKVSERNTIHGRLNETRTLDELREQGAEEDQVAIQDENASPSDKQAAEGRVAERTEELGRLQMQIAERERGLPLSERIKEIFKKYGMTVTAIFM